MDKALGRQTLDWAPQSIKPIRSCKKERPSNRSGPVDVTKVTNVLVSVPDMQREL